MKMTMPLLEALTILAAGTSGEINYHANDESRAIFNEARRTVGTTATALMDARQLTSRAGGFIPRDRSFRQQAPMAVEFNSDDWLAAYHQGRTWPFK